MRLTTTRRRLLALAGALAATLGLQGAAPARAERRLRALLALIPHAASAREVGRRYLASQPAEEADLGRLVASLWPDPDPGEAPAALRHAFARRLREEFAQGRTVRVEGWVLAQSEARLCALHALAEHRGLG